LQGNAQNDSITLSGIVTDFEGFPIDSALVEVKHADFKTAYETLTDSEGKYHLRVLKGEYYAVGALKMSEYPIAGSTLSKDKQKLEFWAWNVIAEKDLTLNMKYHRLEVYGVNIFRIQGANPSYTIYCRPMSLTKYFSFSKSELNNADLAPSPDKLEVKVEINGVEVKVNHKQKVEEYFSDGMAYGYLINVKLPKEQTKMHYDIFRIVMTDLENGDTGEAVSFKRKDNYN
jgi:hypothetical protein